MTPKEAMRRYRQAFLRIVEAEPNSYVEHALEAEIDALPTLVHKKLVDRELERWRLRALAELLPYLNREVIEPSGLQDYPVSPNHHGKPQRTRDLEWRKAKLPEAAMDWNVSRLSVK